MRIPSRILPLFLSLLIACGDVLSPEENLDQSRERWRSAAINSYDFTLDYLGDVPHRTVYEVRNGIATGARDAFTGEPRDFRWTIDELFNLLDFTVKHGRIESLEFDDEYGYPTRVRGNTHPGAIDSFGFQYTMIAFVSR
jgi:hypothetical protein